MCSKRIKKHWEIILTIKGAFPMFFVVRTVKSPECKWKYDKENKTKAIFSLH